MMRQTWIRLGGLALLMLLLGVACSCLALAEPAKGKRVALVVGNSHYVSVGALDNPGNDAKLMAATLAAAGFTLVGGGPQLDLDKAHFDRAVQSFGRAIEGADVALFYYSGHGVQVGAVNYLVPIDSNPTRVQDVQFQMVSANLIMDQLSAGGSKLNVVILDACRNNPFGTRGLRSAGGGLAEMQAPEGTLISYATQPGNVASDGDGPDSPYTSALAQAMRTPGLDLLKLFNKVGLDVKKATRGEQQPWQASSPLEGDFYFTPPNGAAASEAIAAPAPQPPPAKPANTPPAASRNDVPAAPVPHHEPAIAKAKPTGSCSALLPYLSIGADRPSWADAALWRRCGGA